MYGKQYIRTLVDENFALLVILIGVVLITISLGPFQTLDTKLEFDTTRSVLNVGWPILPSTGEVLNEPLWFLYCSFVLQGFRFYDG